MIHLDILPTSMLSSLNASTEQSNSVVEVIPAIVVETPKLESPIDYNLSSETVFTSRDEMYEELFRMDGPLIQASRVARGFARGKGRRKDEQFVDECETEATFIVTSIIFTNLRGVLVKFPTLEERDKFYRMSVGFGLKAYFAHRHTSTISYLQKRGISEKFIPLHSVDFAKQAVDVDMFIASDDAIRNEFERQVVGFYSNGLTQDEIATKLGCNPLRIKNVLRKIRDRLNGDIPKRERKRKETRHRFEGKWVRGPSDDDICFMKLCAGDLT